MSKAMTAISPKGSAIKSWDKADDLRMSKASSFNARGVLLGPFQELRQTGNDEEKIRRLLIIDQSPTVPDLIRACLDSSDDGYQYKVWSTDDYDASEGIIKSVSPEMIIADWTTMLKSTRSSGQPSGYAVPVILMIDEYESYPDIKWSHTGEGIVDCVRKPLGMAEIRARVLLLFGFIEKEFRFKEERTSIRNLMNLKHLELHLELLMHSGNVKDKFLQDVSQLSPYLNREGRSRLKHLVKQFKWALNDESSTSFIRAFDKLNAPLYKCLEDVCDSITRNEKRLCAFATKDQSSSEIAKIMGKTQNSVHVAFARLRAKLGFNSNKDLRMFLLNLTPAFS